MSFFSIIHLLKLIGLYFPLRTKSLIFRFHPFFKFLPPPPSLPPTSTGRLLQSAVSPDMEFLDIFAPLYGDSIIFFTDGSKAKELNPVGLSIYFYHWT